jgi:hypothetical protein
MQLVMQRGRLTGVRGYSFSIVARLIVDDEQEKLLTRYQLRDTILTEGDRQRDLKRAAWYTFPPGVLISLAMASSNLDIIAFVVGLIVTAGACYFVYEQLREEVRVSDLLTGREFRARSFIGLLNKEHAIRRMAAIFEKVLIQARTWHEPEIIDLAPEPLVTLVESEREAA